MTRFAPVDLGWFQDAGDGVHWVALSGPVEVSADGTTMALTTRADVVSPRAPSAPTNLRPGTIRATTVSVRWDEVTDATVAGHRIYVNGTRTGSDLASNALTTTIVGLTASTPYTVTVRRFNTFGESADSNVLPVTTAPPSGSAPTAPTSLSRSNLTASSVTLTWTETADSTVTSHHVYVNGNVFGPTLSASALTTTLTGLSAATPYSVYVTRSNGTTAADESPASNVISFTTQRGGGGGTSPYLYGVSSSGNSHPGPWQVVRVYNFGGPVTEAMGTFNATTLGISADGDVPKARTGATAQRAAGEVLRSRLTTLYNSYPNAKVYYCNGNELDRKGPADPSGQGGSGEGWTEFGQTMAVYRGVVDDFVAAGRFCKLGVDLTQNHVRTDPATENSIKAAVLPYLDFLAFSMYPPGRMATPVEYTDYQFMIDPCFNQAVAWGINEVHCWEWGIPIDTNTTHTTATNETATSVNVRIYGHSSLTTIAVPNEAAVRPMYAAYGARYIADIAASLGMPAPQLCYWDANGTADNRLSNDPAGTSPTTSQAWKNWPTYATLS